MSIANLHRPAAVLSGTHLPAMTIVWDHERMQTLLSPLPSAFETYFPIPLPFVLASPDAVRTTHNDMPDLTSPSFSPLTELGDANLGALERANAEGMLPADGAGEFLNDGLDAAIWGQGTVDRADCWNWSSAGLGFADAAGPLENSAVGFANAIRSEHAGMRWDGWDDMAFHGTWHGEAAHGALHPATGSRPC